MRNFIKWASLVVLLSLFSCAKVEYTGGVFDFSEPGVYGYITPIEIEEAPGTKATVESRTLKYRFEVGDRINIWQDERRPHTNIPFRNHCQFIAETYFRRPFRA